MAIGSLLFKGNGGVMSMVSKLDQAMSDTLDEMLGVMGLMGTGGQVVLESLATVDKQPHYNQGDIECIDALAACLTAEQFVGFCRGNALKYLWRAGSKGDKVLDYTKAQYYLNLLLEVERS